MVERDLKPSHEMILGRCPLPGSIWTYSGKTQIFVGQRAVIEGVVVQDRGRIMVYFMFESRAANSLPADQFLENFTPGL